MTDKSPEELARTWHESSRGGVCPHLNPLQKALRTDDSPFDQYGCMLCAFEAGHASRDEGVADLEQRLSLAEDENNMTVEDKSWRKGT